MWSHLWRQSDACIIEKGITRELQVGWVIETHDWVLDDEGQATDELYQSYGWRVPRYSATESEQWEGRSASIGDNAAQLGQVTINLVADPPMTEGATRIVVRFRGMSAHEASSGSRSSVRPYRVVKVFAGEDEDREAYH